MDRSTCIINLHYQGSRITKADIAAAKSKPTSRETWSLELQCLDAEEIFCICHFAELPGKGYKDKKVPLEPSWRNAEPLHLYHCLSMLICCQYFMSLMVKMHAA